MSGPSLPAQRAVLPCRDQDEFLSDVCEGLSRDQKAIPGKYLWDERGSSIFEAICQSEGYPIALVETALLRECAGEVAGLVGKGACIAEFGSGASRKVRILLDSMDRPRRYIAIDISRDFMGAAAARLKADYPQLDIEHVCADYSKPLSALPIPRPCPVLGFFPGSTMGNMAPGEALQLLTRIKAAVAPGWLLVGQDHTSAPEKLAAAYGGPLMASLHKNILVRLMRDLRARITPDHFEHTVRILSGPVRVEAHLVAAEAAAVEIDYFKTEFAPGDSIRTDISWKHTPSELAALIAAAGWNTVRSWSCQESDYALYLLHSSCDKDTSRWGH